jgi:5,10-methylenetetrahydromethanopterin reductase
MTMRIGLLLAGTRPVGETISLARDAEQAGVEEIWVSEDYFENGGFVLAAAVAANTTRATIGLGVINPWTRHPLLTAMEFATLSELIPQRAILGLGASNQGWMQDRCGIPFRSPVGVLEEATDIIRNALSGHHVAFSGRHFRVDARLARPPTDHAKIYFGVKGPRMLASAARYADGVVLSIMSSPGYIRWVREKVGPGVDMCAYVLAACGSEARRDIRPAVAHYLGIHGVHDITTRGGLDAATANEFRQARLTGHSLDHAVTEEIIDNFAAAGDAHACLAALDRFCDAGLNSAILKDPGDSSVDSLLQLARTYRDRQLQTAHERTPNR